MNEHVKETLRMLVANLVGDESRTFQMGMNLITPQDVPDDMPVEREVLALVRLCDLANPRLPPRPETIEELLMAGGKPDYIPQFRTLIQQYRTSESEIPTLAFVLRKFYFQQAKNSRIAQEIVRIIESPNGLPEERLRDAARLISREMPGLLSAQPYDLGQGLELWRSVQLERAGRLEAGLALGPNWPFSHLCGLIPHMKPGELTTMMMKTKFCKSTLAGILSEYWGLVQHYRVLVLLFETSVASYMDRVIARNCKISTFDQRTGRLDLRRLTPAAREALDDFSRRIDGYKQNIRILPCPGWGPLELEPVIRAEQEVARADGQELIVVWDYYQQIARYLWHDQTNSYNACSDWLKTFTEQEAFYSFVLCQEKDDLKEPKEGTNIITRSQNFMRMQRTWATNTERPVYEHFPDEDGRGGVIAKDTMGNDRYYHRPGKLHSDAWIHVVLSNDDQSGSVKLLTEMSLFSMYEHHQQEPLPFD